MISISNRHNKIIGKSGVNELSQFRHSSVHKYNFIRVGFTHSLGFFMLSDMFILMDYFLVCFAFAKLRSMYLVNHLEIKNNVLQLIFVFSKRFRNVLSGQVFSCEYFEILKNSFL